MAESQGVFAHVQLQIASINTMPQGVIKRIKLGNLQHTDVRIRDIAQIHLRVNPRLNSFAIHIRSDDRFRMKNRLRLADAEGEMKLSSDWQFIVPRLFVS